MKMLKSTQRPLLLLTMIVSGLFMNACTFGSANVIKGDGNVVASVHEVGYFNNLDISGMFDIKLSPGEGQPVIFETDENLQEYLKLRVRGNTLYVSTTGDDIFRPTKMKLHIHYPALEKISIGGACKLGSDKPVVSDKLTLQVSGAADIELTVEAKTLNTRVSGAANIKLNGNVDKHRADLSGASNVRAEKLYTSESRISLSGAGSAHVYATESMDVSLSGLGNVRYYGEPKNIKISKSGLGSIKAAE